MVVTENIKKVYGEVLAIKALSFTAAEGELFGFIGPDGAGKTSLFRILTTLLLPDGGKATLDGIDIVKNYRQIRNVVGYMPGRFSLYSDLSVQENLEFFATVFGTTIEANYHLIRDIYAQIEPFKNRRAGRLSGGMKQKLALSCALIHQPKVLILDEPTTGVDAVSRREFWELLKGLKARGITILVSTPYMDEAGMCDKVALIQKGEILATDRPDQIVDNFDKQLYSIKAPGLYKLLKDLRRFPDCESVFPFGQELHYTHRKENLDKTLLQSFLEQNGHDQISIEPVDAGIEDVFMSMMNELDNAKSE